MKVFNTRYKIIIGALLFATGIPAAKGDFLQTGREAFMNYDFERASENYEKYMAALKKKPNPNGEQLLETYQRQLQIAENSLENVQKIEIIDRIDVPAEDFFKNIKLPVSGGKLLSANSIPFRDRKNESDFAFTTEGGDAMMWSESDADGNEIIMQSERLLDGTWEDAHEAGSILNDGGNARNPFMLSDGLTLYYTSDGEGSMGGFDLFVATKDSATGQFRQPIGLGYPFNSPYNEYLMAIDEDNGIGWWVTDRNKIDGQVSVYIFKTNEIRKNYDSEEEDDIVSLARIDDISITQNPDTDYNEILKGINERSRITQKDSNSEFIFPLPGRKVASRLSDFSNSKAKKEMQKYLKASEDMSQLQQRLSELRKKYHATDRKKSSSTALKNQILELEQEREILSGNLKEMRNQIISLEYNL